jgi:hypothetical protein
VLSLPIGMRFLQHVANRCGQRGFQAYGIYHSELSPPGAGPGLASPERVDGGAAIPLHLKKTTLTRGSERRHGNLFLTLRA